MWSSISPSRLNIKHVMRFSKASFSVDWKILHSRPVIMVRQIGNAAANSFIGTLKFKMTVLRYNSILKEIARWHWNRYQKPVYNKLHAGKEMIAWFNWSKISFSKLQWTVHMIVTFPDLYVFSLVSLQFRKKWDLNFHKSSRGNIHWASKETYHFFKVTHIKIQSIKMNDNWA